MPTLPTSDDITIIAKRGGVQHCAPATCAQERAQLCTVAWAASSLLGGETVRVRGYLPGMDLDIRATRFLEPHMPMREAELDWPNLERRLWDVLDQPAQREAYGFVEWDFDRVIHHPSTRQDAAGPVAFTLECVWPGVLGG